MTRSVKILIGLAAVLLMGWIWHGPMGRGAAFVDALEAEAKDVVAYAELPMIKVRLGRDPLSRNATLSGPADDFQRHGMKDEPGLGGRVGLIDGIGGVRWVDEPRRGGWALPLLVETEIQLALAYALGFGLGALLFGRRKRQSFLDY
jgi:hypothetical protein